MMLKSWGERLNTQDLGILSSVLLPARLCTVLTFLSKCTYLEGRTKAVFHIRGTHYQYC